MGLVHKFLKRRNLERQNPIMDLTTSRNSRNDLAPTIEAKAISDLDLVPKYAADDNQFTTEQIIQLCQFLAEKSKKNRKPHKGVASGLTKSKQQLQNRREPFSDEINTLEHKQYQNYQHKPSKTFDLHTTNHKRHILKTNFYANSDFIENVCSLNSTDKSTLKNIQEKSDILLKIRDQIFERKRRRQKTEEQFDVWRPWR